MNLFRHTLPAVRLDPSSRGEPLDTLSRTSSRQSRLILRATPGQACACQLAAPSLKAARRNADFPRCLLCLLSLLAESKDMPAMELMAAMGLAGTEVGNPLMTANSMSGM